MKKIGATSSGTVIVEMTEEQFIALKLINTPLPVVVQPSPELKKIESKSSVSSMPLAERIEYVKERIKKQPPKKKDKLGHFIDAMFGPLGGIDAPTIDRVIAGLQKAKVINIDAAGKVTYNGA